MSEFILASASPRRLQLLKQLGYTPNRVVSPDIDETVRKGELPTQHAERLAQEKARAVAALHPDAVILAADTVVACGRRILPKAEDAATATKCLTLLSGRRHRVYTAICIAHNGTFTCVTELTHVRFIRLSTAQINAYVATNEWQGKAGGYGIQGCAEAFIPWINGSFSNVVGLPLAQTCLMLTSMGITPAGGK